MLPLCYWISSLGRRSMAVWMCADMLTVLLHQLFGNREVIATPASCFQQGELCVYPRVTIKSSREPRFNHMHHSCPTETHCSKCRAHWYQKSCPKPYCLITKGWGSLWPDDDPCNYSLHWDSSSSSCLRQLWKELARELGTCGDGLISRVAVTYPRKVSNECRRLGWSLRVFCSASEALTCGNKDNHVNQTEPHLWLFSNTQKSNSC